MVEIKKTLKELAIRNFKDNAVYERTAKSILSLLNTPAYKSDNMRMFPEVDEIEVNNIDALHDEVTLLWSDLKLKGIMTWKEGRTLNNIKTYCLVSYE